MAIRSYRQRATLRRLERYQHMSVDAFLHSGEFSDGVHVISLGAGVNLQMRIAGNPWAHIDERRIPVFFTGHIGTRKAAKPPFFSGNSMGEKLDRGWLAFSDPLVETEKDIVVGWYVGKPEWRLQDSIGDILSGLQEIYGVRFLTVGGSAGGYAALEAASRLPDARAFVWNPQTAVMAFPKVLTRPVMRAVFDDAKWVDNDATWQHEGIRRMKEASIVCDLRQSSLPEAGTLVLQNDADWQVAQHIVPLIRRHNLVKRDVGFYAGDDVAIMLGHFGPEHSRPSHTIIEDACRSCMVTDADIVAVAERLRADYSIVPLDLNGVPEELR